MHPTLRLSKDFEKVLAGKPAQAIRLIKVFIPSIMTWSSDGTHETYKGAFSEKTYESVTKLIDPEPIYHILKKAGYKPADVNFNAIDERSKMSDEELPGFSCNVMRKAATGQKALHRKSKFC